MLSINGQVAAHINDSIPHIGAEKTEPMQINAPGTKTTIAAMLS